MAMTDQPAFLPDEAGRMPHLVIMDEAAIGVKGAPVGALKGARRLGLCSGAAPITGPRTLYQFESLLQARSRLSRGEVAPRPHPVPNVALFAAWASLWVPILVALVIWWWV